MSLRFWAVCVWVLSGLNACSGGDTICRTDADCAARFHCVVGVCEACGFEEIPYDGIDNDCFAATRDADVDGDGDNGMAAPRPGGDCDDQDPNRSSIALEVCADNIDNDCDGEVDEPTCGDKTSPSVAFIRPRIGATLSGTAEFELDVLDDVGIVSVELSAETINLTTLSAPPWVGTFDSNRLPDGQVVLSARAEDMIGRVGSIAMPVIVDNGTAPKLTVYNPEAGISYGGTMAIEVRAEDIAGIRLIEYRMDGLLVGSLVANSTAAFARAVVDTTRLDEGEHLLEVLSEDRAGNRDSSNLRFFVDNTEPAITFTPADGASVAGQVTIRIEASDPAGVVQLSALGAQTASGVLELGIDTTNLPNGAWEISATARDGAIISGRADSGNTAEAAITLTILN